VFQKYKVISRTTFQFKADVKTPRKKWQAAEKWTTNTVSILDQYNI